MTKFEEEVKRPDNGPITELNNNMQQVFSQYRKMRQYADYLEYELKQKDEHILKLENENSFMRDERTTFDSNGNSVEPIIPQQALPVVPDFIAEWIECVKGKNNNALALLDDDNMPDDVNEWLFFQRNDDNINLILRAWLDGYTVEKPQLFYLKNKITGDLLFRKNSGYKDDYCEIPEGNLLNKKSAHFTKAEIDSMHAESYEQIEVEEEK